MKKSEVKKQLINHVHSMNKQLTYAYLESLSNQLLINMSHPMDRHVWAKELTGITVAKTW